MDADILADPVKQKEVLEKTNHADHSLAARKRRLKQKALKSGKDIEVVERVELVMEARGEAYNSEVIARSRSEIEGRFLTDHMRMS
jgi:hypothetical protein